MQHFIKRISDVQKSMRITIPRQIVEQMGIQKNDAFVVFGDGEKIIMAPLEKESHVRYGLAVDRAIRKYGSFLEEIDE